MKAKMEFSKRLVVSFIFLALALNSCATNDTEKQMDSTLSHSHYAKALTMLEAGRISLEQKNKDENKAIEAFQLGIETLGSLYQHPDLIDDTEMKLILAKNSYKNGKTAEAVVLFERVLESRMTVYKEYFKPEVK